jgi:hypothetical protein
MILAYSTDGKNCNHFAGNVQVLFLGGHGGCYDLRDFPLDNISKILYIIQTHYKKISPTDHKS